MKKKRKDKRVVRPKKCVMEAPENVDESKIHSLQLVLGADFSRDKMVHFLACADGDVEKTLQMYFSNEFEEDAGLTRIAGKTLGRLGHHHSHHRSAEANVDLCLMS